jgi:hypothetical protein
LPIAYCLLPIDLNHSKPLVAERSPFIHLADHVRIEGVARTAAAPPRTAAGMYQCGALRWGQFAAAEFENIAIYII